MKRTVAKSQFTRLEKSLKKLLENQDSLQDTIERKFNELSAKWKEVQNAHDIYVTLIKEEEADQEERWIEELLSRFDDIEAEADKVLLKFKEQNQVFKEGSNTATQFAESQNTLMEKSRLQLERLKLEKFDGDLRKYPAFKERFRLYIEPMCPKSQTAFMLRSHLEPTVREEVVMLRIMTSCYGNGWIQSMVTRGSILTLLFQTYPEYQRETEKLP